MTSPVYSDPLLIAAAKKIEDIINELPEELRFYTLYWLGMMRSSIETGKTTQENREYIRDNSILQYASYRGLFEAEKFAKEKLANGQLESSYALKELELLYSNWQRIAKENKEKENGSEESVVEPTS